MKSVIEFEGVSKRYRLGEVGTGTLSHDLHRCWARIRGKPDPFAIITEHTPASQRPLPRNNSSKFVAEEIIALDDITFSVECGQVLGIIGHNGAGKSTLLKLLSRITAPTSGEIRIRGKIMSLLEVGTGFHPELTGLENIHLNGAILGMSRSEIASRIDQIVEFSECEKFLGTPVKRYSSGMVLRLGFAVAAHLSADILVVDEVLAVGDSDFQKKCVNRIATLTRSEGKTVLLVSHNLAAINAMTDTCMWLDRGKLSGVGPTATMVARYLSSRENDQDSSEPGVFHPKPSTSKKHLLRSIRLIPNGVLSDSMRMGDNLKIEIELASQDAAYDQVLVGLIIEDHQGNRVATVGSIQDNFAARLLAGTVKSVGCDFGKIPLNQGSYYLKIVLSTSLGEIIESHDSIATLSVVPDDVFGNGQFVQARHGKIFWKTHWNELESDSS